MADIKLHQLYQAFQQAFPLEKLDEMTLEQYTNLNKKDSFCYWLESLTYALGSIWGGSSYKFGIYRYQKRPATEDPRIKYDDEYAWYSKYEVETREDAFDVVKAVIMKIATAARNGNYEVIDDINELGNSYKWKIAFLYSDEKLLPIYKKVYLREAANLLGGNFSNNSKTSEMQKFLIARQGEKDIYDYYYELWNMLPDKVKKGKDDDEDNDAEGVRYWLYAPGDGASEWQRCLKTSTMCLGWD